MIKRGENKMSKNDDWFEKVMKKIDEDAKSGKLQQYFKEIFEEEERQKEYVNNREFFEWIVEFVDKLRKMKRTYSTEDFLYMEKDRFTEKDIENEKYIGSCIFDLFEEVGRQQGKEPIIDDSWSFPDTEWYFKFNNRMFFICQLIGQGTEYILRTASNKEKNYLDLDLYFENFK